MSDSESLFEAALLKGREGSFIANVKRPATTENATENADNAEGEGVENVGCYGFFRGRHERAVHLEFRLKKGPWPAPGYPWLVKAEFDPSGGITLYYASGDRVVINGRNLRPIHERILAHQALWIEEQGLEWRSKGTDGLTVVYGIDYHEAEAEGEGA